MSLASLRRKKYALLVITYNQLKLNISLITNDLILRSPISTYSYYAYIYELVASLNNNEN